MARYRADEIHPVLLRDRIGRPNDYLLEPERDARGRATGFHVQVIGTADDYREYAKRRLSEQGKPPLLLDRPGRPVAYVSAGRWVIDCDCGAGAAAWPEETLAICCQCGSVWRPVFPPRLLEAERVLLVRPGHEHRHWFPDHGLARRWGLEKAETVDILKAENAGRGLGRR